MRYRDNKQFYLGGIHHAYNRGVNKENIFLEASDNVAFLLRLGILIGLPKPSYSNLSLHAFRPSDFDVLGYCLMPNHFHLQIQQKGDVPTSELLHKLCTSYAMYFNRKYKRLGPLWQDTFKAKDVTDDPYLLTLSAYIHNNPANPDTYVYSSYQDYLGLRESRLCKPALIMSQFSNSIEQYKSFVEGWRKKDVGKVPFWG